MLTNPERMARFERLDTRRRFGDMSFSEALAMIEALWSEAAGLDPDFPRRWQSDFETDFAIARGINGLPPHP